MHCKKTQHLKNRIGCHVHLSNFRESIGKKDDKRKIGVHGHVENNEKKEQLSVQTVVLGKVLQHINNVFLICVIVRCFKTFVVLANIGVKLL